MGFLVYLYRSPWVFSSSLCCGTNGKFSEKVISKQFVPNLLVPLKLEPIILFLKIKIIFLLFFTSFTFGTPSGLLRYLVSKFGTITNSPVWPSLLAQWGEWITPCVCGREFTVHKKTLQKYYELIFLIIF